MAAAMMLPGRLEAQAFVDERQTMLKIISGGQTGVDRAALDVAIELGLAYGGWSPQGGWAEDMPDPPGLLALYPALRETPERDPRERTEWNVRDSDAVLVLTDAAGHSVSKGTGFALECVERTGKPHLLLDLDAVDAGKQASAWLGARQRPLALCIGGPRESEAPGIYVKARAFLRGMIERM
jgi:hypothetical protein